MGLSPVRQRLNPACGQRTTSPIGSTGNRALWIIEKRTRYGGELHWILGPLAASYEFNRVVWDDIQVFSSGKWQADYSGENHVDVHSVWVSYFLTGEEKSFEDAFFCWRQPKPKKNFSLKDGTWGAWEVLARYVYHDASEDLFEGKNAILDGSNKGYTMTGGLRWIWNPKVKNHDGPQLPEER